MLLVVPVTDDLGQYVGKTLRASQTSMLSYLARPWRDIMEEGRISQVARSHKVSKPRDLSKKQSYRSDICDISEQNSHFDIFKYKC